MISAEIIGIEFGVLSPDEIRSMSVTQEVVLRGEKIPAGIHNQSLRNVVDGTPYIGGPFDPRMGDPKKGPGYFGHCELARPVYHIGFIDTTLSILKCISYHNSKLLLDEDELNLIEDTGKTRFQKILEKCKNKKVDLDGNEQPKYKKDKLVIRLEFQNERRELRAIEALLILQKMSDRDIIHLGFNPERSRPEWMIVTVLPIPPISVRPSVAINDSNKSEDDLTHKINDIVKVNNKLQQYIKEKKNQEKIDEEVAHLQYHIATYVNNNTTLCAQHKQRNGKPLRTFAQRLSGKEGRVRGNLMGKRVDFTARTVITADPNLSVDQVGVPIEIALNLTIPEVVNQHNILKLQKLVNNGPNIHPGAKYVIKSNGAKLDLRYARKVILENGWMVERHLDNDDVVMFNRQPSLHKMSIMGHRVKVQNFSTFRLNLSATSPYNADFDGDEMNLHVPQGIQARAEIESMMMVDKLIVSPQSNKPVMGIVQDSLLAAALLTERGVLLNKEEMMQAIMWNEEWTGGMPHPAIFVPNKNKDGITTSADAFWTGKQLFSTIIPDEIQLTRFNNSHPDEEKIDELTPHDTWVRIIDGELLSGRADKSVLGTSQGGLIHVVYNDLGHGAARKLLNNVQKVCNHWMMNNSFTVGVGDTIADNKTLDKVSDILNEVKYDVENVIKQRDNGFMNILPGRTLEETFESIVNDKLNKARDDSGKLAERSLHKNAFKQTATSGSKGSFINISQIMACVGQQNVEGKRIPNRFNNRSLPHFKEYDSGAPARGFVKHSYVQGLNPQEFFFHAMAGREGVIDTACKTAATGYVQRRLVKSIEDLTVKYDGTVRNAQNNVVQFLYGEDGMDGVAIESQKISSFNEKQMKWDGELSKNQRDEWLQLLEDEEEYQRCIPCGYLPVPLYRLIQQAQQKFNDTLVECDVVINDIRLLCNRLNVVKGVDDISKEAQYNSTLLLKIHIRRELCSKKAIEHYKLTENGFKYIIEQIERKFYKAIVNPGEMCGVLAAQSLGEPTTQMTLNTFHLAGVSAKNVTLGLPRLTEIINVSKNIKTPTVTIYLKDGFNLEDAEEVVSNMEYTTLDDLIVSTTSKKPDFVSMYEELPSDIDYTHEHIKWSCIELNISKCIYKGLTLDEIVQKIEQHHIEVIASDDNSVKWLLWVNDKLPSIHLRGIENISKVIMREEQIKKTNNTEWILDTDGTNLQEVFAQDGVDQTKTISNDIVEIKDVLGIEAARAALLNELRYVISFDGTYINYRHIALLVDAMTYKGILVPITRHGINRMDGVSPFHRCSFEETVDILMDAAIYSETDDLSGITSNILLGKIAPCGTGTFDLIEVNDVIEKHTSINTSVNNRTHVFEKTSEIVDMFMPEEESTFNYIPSSPQFTYKKASVLFNYIPSSPQFTYNK